MDVHVLLISTFAKSPTLTQSFKHIKQNI